MKNSSISISESLQLKGIALILLLCHHLFYIQEGLYSDFTVAGHGVVQEFGMVCKVCVAIFVTLSGYGLGVQYRDKELCLWQFYKRRFTKLMTNYWLMWLLFVPVGMVFFGRTLSAVYGEHEYIKLLINLLGLQDYAGFSGVNPTWWFMSCIIGLYLLFPALIKILKHINPAFVLLFSFVLMWQPLSNLYCLSLYLFPFVLGYVLSRKPLIVSGITGGGGKWLLFLLLIVTILWRQFGLIITGMKIDPILAVEIVLLYKSLNVKNNKITTILEFLGKHSMNIFLFHTFIFGYYMRDIVYATKDPLIIFVTLSAICLVISIGIEYLKKLVFRK